MPLRFLERGFGLREEKLGLSDWVELNGREVPLRVRFIGFRVSPTIRASSAGSWENVFQ